MNEIEFFMQKHYGVGKLSLFTKTDLQFMVKSDSEDVDELMKLWEKEYTTIKLIRMIGMQYDNN